MRIERLGELGDPVGVLGLIANAALDSGRAAPAALIGTWFGAGAVIAPTLAAAELPPGEAFGAAPGPGSDGPIGGGWFGYLSYPDAGADGQPGRIPAAAAGWSDCVLRQDRGGTWWYESLSGRPMAKWVARSLTASQQRTPWRIDWDTPDRPTHHAGVLACLDAISAGEVYQACVCTQFAGRVLGAPIDFFLDTVRQTTPTRAAFLAGPWGAVASLSPEMFLRRRGGAVASSPIKGTLPRDADPAELRRSAKDVAENIMIVDLVRNDLGRVAATGTVTVPELLAVRPAPGVWHLVSTVSAKVAPELPMSELLEATFPPASVTGTPKTRARQLLSTWEPRRRGIFCGTVGMLSPVAGCELNVAIRTVEFDAYGGAVLGVGGGITADSHPDAEWAECLHKAAPIVGTYCLERSTAS